MSSIRPIASTSMTDRHELVWYIVTKTVGAMSLILIAIAGACDHVGPGDVRSTSPNGKYELRIVEKEGLDRNFEVILRSSRGGERVVFISPDEGRPSGTERFIWSADSDAALLVGQHFFVRADTPILERNQEALYLLLPSALMSAPS